MIQLFDYEMCDQSARGSNIYQIMTSNPYDSLYCERPSGQTMHNFLQDVAYAVRKRYGNAVYIIEVLRRDQWKAAEDV